MLSAKIPLYLLLCGNHRSLEMEISLVYASTCYNTPTKLTLVLLYYCCIEETGTGLYYRADSGGSGLIWCATPASSAERNALLVAAEAASELHNKTPFHKAPQDSGTKTVLQSLNAADVSQNMETVNCRALWYKIKLWKRTEDLTGVHIYKITLDMWYSLCFLFTTNLQNNLPSSVILWAWETNPDMIILFLSDRFNCAGNNIHVLRYIYLNKVCFITWFHRFIR